MSILISGAMGTYGQAIIKTAATQKHTVVALGRDENKLNQQKQTL